MSFLENKIPPPLVCVVFGLLMFWTSTLASPIMWNHEYRVLLFLIIWGIGILLCVTGILEFKRAKTTINPLKPDAASSLVDSGVYRLSRNPMYLGFALFLVALAVYLSSLLSFVGVVGFIVYMNQFQIKPEERAIESIFGDAYMAYKSKVRRWL